MSRSARAGPRTAATGARATPRAAWAGTRATKRVRSILRLRRSSRIRSRSSGVGLDSLALRLVRSGVRIFSVHRTDHPRPLRLDASVGFHGCAIVTPGAGTERDETGDYVPERRHHA